MSKPEATSAATPTYTLTYNSNLTEDYIHTDAILASPTAPSPLATFLNSQGQSEALVIYNDGELCHLQREPLSSSGWNFCGIGAVVQSIAAVNSGSVWITDNDQTIWQSNAGHWNFISALPGGAQAISVGTDGTVYGFVNEGPGSNFHLFTFDPTTQSFQDQGTAPGVPYGKPGALWAIAEGKLLTNSNGLPWHAVYAEFLKGDVPQQLSVGSDSSLWILCANGAIYSYDPPTATCKKLSGVPANVVELAAANAQTLYVLTGAHLDTRQLLTNAGGNWKEIPHPAVPLNDISVGNDGALWALDGIGRVWLYLDGGWKRRMTPTDLSGFTGGHNVTEVVTGQHTDGVQYAFFVMDNNLWWSDFVEKSGDFGGYWNAQGILFAGCSTIAAMNDPITTQLVVYGVSSKGNFVLVLNDGKHWVATEHSMKTSLSGVKPQFVSYGHWFTYAVINKTLYVGQGSSLTAPAATLSPAKTTGAPSDLELQSLIPFSASPQGMYGDSLAAIDTKNRVWFINASSAGAASFSQLSGQSVGSTIGNVRSAVAMMRPVEGARIYARDDNDMLWVIRQTGRSGALIVWSDWHPLGNECKVLGIGCTIPLPNSPKTAPVDLFSLDEGYEVNVLSEDPVTGALTDLVMLKPDGTNSDAEYVTRYLSELTIVDETSTPQPGFQVTVKTDEAVGIWVGSNLYNLSPASPVQLTTNELGQITFAFFAADLHTPTFSFSADGLKNPPSVYPARAVNDYLAGSATAMPNRPVFTPDGATLLNAKMQTGPSWNTQPTSLVSGDNKDLAPKVAGAIASIYTMPVSATGDSGQWSVAPSQPMGVSFSSFWHDLCNFPHDIEHAIKKAALMVHDIEVNMKDRLVAFTVKLANGLTQVLHLAINTIKDLVSAVKSLFRYIERGVDDVIHWLKSLFSWNDILNTKKVIETCLNGVMTKLVDNFDTTSPVYVGKIFDTYFNDLESAVIDGFDKAKAHFGKAQTLSEATASQQYPEGARPMGNDPLSPTNINGAQSSNGNQSNYVHTHVTNYTSQGGSFPPSAMGDGTAGDSILVGLFDAIDRNLKQGAFQNEHMRTIDSLKSIFSDPQNFANVVVYDIITAIEDLVDIVLKVIQGVIDELLSLTGNALKGFQTLMNKQIDIPVISWIYKQISHHPLTILDLVSLALAVPATVLYKLTFGLPNATPPFTDQQTDQIVATFSDPSQFPWPAIASSGLTATPALVGSFPFEGAQVLIPNCFVFFTVADMAADGMAYIKAQTPATFAKAPAFFWSIVKIIGALSTRWLTAPFPLFPTGGTTLPEKLQLAFWAAGFAPIAAGLVFAMGSSGKAIPEFNALWGVPLISGIGTLLLLLGVAASGAQIAYSPKINIFQAIQNVIAPLPIVLKFNLLTRGQPESAVALAILLGTDGVCDLGNGALGLVTAITT
jgi:hypothetical protein